MVLWISPIFLFFFSFSVLQFWSFKRHRSCDNNQDLTPSSSETGPALSFVIKTELKLLSFDRSRSLIICTWTWTGSSTSARTPTTRTCTSASPRRRSSPTSSTTSKCSFASSSPGRCSSWPWTESHRGPKWTSSAAEDSGTNPRLSVLRV